MEQMLTRVEKLITKTKPRSVPALLEWIIFVNNFSSQSIDLKVETLIKSHENANETHSPEQCTWAHRTLSIYGFDLQGFLEQPQKRGQTESVHVVDLGQVADDEINGAATLGQR